MNVWSNIYLLPHERIYLLFSRYIESEWKKTRSFERISDTFTVGISNSPGVFFNSLCQYLIRLIFLSPTWFLKPFTISIEPHICYIWHPVCLISVIFTAASKSDKQLCPCSESVSIFYLRRSLSQQQLYCQPVCLSSYFIKKQTNPF